MRRPLITLQASFSSSPVPTPDAMFPWFPDWKSALAARLSPRTLIVVVELGMGQFNSVVTPWLCALVSSSVIPTTNRRSRSHTSVEPYANVSFSLGRCQVPSCIPNRDYQTSKLGISCQPPAEPFETISHLDAIRSRFRVHPKYC